MRIGFSTNIKIAIVYAMALFLLSADRLFKIFAGKLTGQTVDIWPWLSFHYQSNYGIAFSLPFGGWLLVIVSIIAICYIGRFTISYYQKKQPQMALPLSLIGIGAIGNLTDRLLYGYVIDYLDLRWFVCNIADILITTGVAILLIVVLFKKGR